MFASPILLGLSSIASGVLQTFKSFLVYSLTPIMYNAGIIVGALMFVPIFGEIGLAYGVILGAFLHLVIQLPTLFHLGYNYKAVLPWNNPHIKKIGRMMVPRTMGLAAKQLNFLVITILASTLAAGSLTIFNFANNIQYFPIGIIGYSFAIAAFPTLSELISEDKKEEMIEHLVETTRKILYFIVPATIIFLLLRIQIVRVVFGSGQFGWDATIQTGHALAFFSLSLFAQAIIPLLVRGFFAIEDTWTPFVIAFISALFNIILALLLKDQYGVIGLAMAFSFSMIAQFAMLWVTLRVKLGTLLESKIVPLLYKVSVAGLAMAVVTQYAKYPLSKVVDMTRFWGIFLQGFAAGCAGLLVYAGITYLLNVEEIYYIKASMKKKWLKWTNVQSEIDGPDEV